MAQTSYLGIMVAPSGHRLVMQAGTHAFTTSAKKCTLTLKFKRPVAGFALPGQVVSGGKTARVASYIPYVSTTQYTQTIAGAYHKKLVIKRLTGTISGLKFSYQVIGY